MPLTAGTRLGPYEIVGAIGAGGMGEVYRAKDTKLGRDVAIKALPESFAKDADRVARFIREAKTLASLNHPNIAQIHGLEESGDVHALVMELVEGEDLSKRMARGAVPPEEAWPIARQIADALEAAHEQGIIHRDLKPANIKLRQDGTVKVLDFGLAKALGHEGADTATEAMNSPTFTAHGTQMGVILGTAAYMSPEQARGKPVDRRADIWAYGVVMWEMLTGRRLFDGESASEVIAAVLTTTPTWDGIPPQFQYVLRRCLEKDPKRRLHDIGDARLLLEEGPLPDRPAHSANRAWLPWAVVAILAIALAAALLRSRTAAAPDTLVTQFALPAPRGTEFSNGSAGAVSPDGRYLVFAADNTSGVSLWLRPFDSQDVLPIPGTDGGSQPSWSPDSKSVIFRVNGTLKRVDIIAGGTPQVVIEMIGLSMLGGAAWSPDQTVLVAAVNGLYLAPASGVGGARTLAEPDPARHELGFGYPQFLPDGRFLYFIQSSDPNTEGLYVGSIERPRERRIMSTHDRATFVPPRGNWPGYLVFLRDQALMAQRFDVSKLEPEGEPIRLAEGVRPSATNATAFSVSAAGPLVYRTGGVDSDRKLTWFNRDGTNQQDATPSGQYQSLRLSPDGKHVAFDAANGVEDIWRLEFARNIPSILTSGGRRDVVPVWSPDGKQIAFMSNRTNVFQLYLKDARGGGEERQLTEGPNGKYLTDWTHDGRYLLYYEIDPNTKNDLWALPLDGSGKAVPLLRTPANEQNGVLSKDGKWIAYASDKTGREEVYIRPFLAEGDEWPVSNQGGSRPKWREDQAELFYLGPGRNTVMAADVRITGTHLETAAPHQLFGLPSPLPVLVSPYDVTADGQRFLVLGHADTSAGSAALTVAVNWQAALKK